jgi:hypothetical protein
MPPQQNPELEAQEKYLKNIEKLRQGLGVAFCTKNKEGGICSLQEQITLAQEMDLATIQLDFRNRKLDDILDAKDVMLEYRRLHPDVAVSIHGQTTQIDASTLDFKNRELTLGEIEFLQEMSGESYTIHPPHINSRIFKELPEDVREKILQNYANIFAEAVLQAISKDKRFSLAFENMSNVGDEGSWGQNIEDILTLIKRVENTIIDKGIDPEIARSFVGATLDVNHALHGAELEDYDSVLNLWFSKLGEYLKVVHLYTPSEASEDFKRKCKLSIELAAQHNPNARLFMETKQGADATKRSYGVLKEV